MSKNESLIQYGTSFQSKIITSLLLSNKFIKTVYDILEVNYFDSDSNKFLIKEIKKYFDKFVEWDKRLIKKLQDRVELSDYKMLCISFAKGFIIGAILL